MSKTRIARNALNAQGVIRSANLSKAHYHTTDPNADQNHHSEVVERAKKKLEKKANNKKII